MCKKHSMQYNRPISIRKPTVGNWILINWIIYMLSWVEYGKSFIPATQIIQLSYARCAYTVFCRSFKESSENFFNVYDED